MKSSESFPINDALKEVILDLNIGSTIDLGNENFTPSNIGLHGETSPSSILYRNDDSLENVKTNDMQSNAHYSECIMRSDNFMTDMLSEPYEETRYSQNYEVGDGLVEQSTISAENKLLGKPIECSVDPDGFIVPCSKRSAIIDIRKRKHPFQERSNLIMPSTITLLQIMFRRVYCPNVYH
jgi:hypothetical protein